VKRMCGSETLIPYLEDSGDDQPIIIVDSREATTATKILKGLKEAGAKIKVQPLVKGDYVLSDQCAIERKTVKDFVYTLTHRYLFEQLFQLKEAYQKPFILIEGYFPIIYKFSKINPSSVWGAMFALAKQGILFIHTTKYQESVDFLYTAAKQEQIVEKRTVMVHPVKKVDTVAEAQIFFMASLPNIGREKARSILKTYESPLNALVNVDSWAKDVRGLGPKIVGKVKNVLYTPHTEQT